MSRLFDTNPEDILEQFQVAYNNQFGSRMTIGSEEYMIASSYAYVMSVYAASLNLSYSQTLIEDATGEFLDNIASRYGLSRSSSMLDYSYIEMIATFKDYDRNFDVDEYSIVFDGHTYRNMNKFQGGKNVYIRWICKDTDVQKLENEDILNELDGELFDKENTTIIGMNAKYTVLDDSSLRKHIQDSRYLHAAGIAGAFEAVAMNVSNVIEDARVRVQSDEKFVKGNVDIFIKFDQRYISNTAMTEYLLGLVKTQIEQSNILTVGQTLNVIQATTFNIGYSTFEVYLRSSEASNQSIIKDKYAAVVNELNHDMKIKGDLIVTELLSRLNSPLKYDHSDKWDSDYITKLNNVSVIGLSLYRPTAMYTGKAESYYRLNIYNPITFNLVD